MHKGAPAKMPTWSAAPGVESEDRNAAAVMAAAVVGAEAAAEAAAEVGVVVGVVVGAGPGSPSRATA
jgi:hypothetical protein